MLTQEPNKIEVQKIKPVFDLQKRTNYGQKSASKHTYATLMGNDYVDVYVSYQTPIVVVMRKDGSHFPVSVFVNKEKYSVTTSRHKNIFLKESNFVGPEKFDVEEDTIKQLLASLGLPSRY